MYSRWGIIHRYLFSPAQISCWRVTMLSAPQSMGKLNWITTKGGATGNLMRASTRVGRRMKIQWRRWWGRPGATNERGWAPTCANGHRQGWATAWRSSGSAVGGDWAQPGANRGGPPAEDPVVAVTGADGRRQAPTGVREIWGREGWGQGQPKE
jgi:hypothetical protein